ncbi:response regulator [Methylobacterium durans]|uniref:response regulator n=1 Tax=Methylobacterium durans TaxID=2202825 RepID=UPI0013A5A320|nr:response regulator transcription factor [Methylobacterium durans]
MSGGGKTTVLVADDHPIVLSGLTMLLKQTPGCEVVASCADGASALRKIEEFEPMVACLDIQMPRLSGLDVLKMVRGRGLRTRIVFLTASLDETTSTEASASGAWAVLHKDCAADALIDCIGAVAIGRRWTSRHEPHCPLANRAEPGPRPCTSAAILTPREQEITLLVAEGLSNKDIARTARISEGTVKIHLYNIYQKLGISNRTSLASYAHQVQINGAPHR